MEKLHECTLAVSGELKAFSGRLREEANKRIGSRVWLMSGSEVSWSQVLSGVDKRSR